jgi:hypothetical protein
MREILPHCVDMVSARIDIDHLLLRRIRRYGAELADLGSRIRLEEGADDDASFAFGVNYLQWAIQGSNL